MSAFITITLDTTAPSLEAALVENSDTGVSTLTLTSADAEEMKVWGDIDVTWPGNDDFAETEGEASWIEFDPSVTMRLVGAKRVRVKVRDDVWNESDTEALQISTPEEEPVTPTVQGWAPPPVVAEEPVVRVVKTVSRLVLRSLWITFPQPSRSRGGISLTAQEFLAAKSRNARCILVASETEVASRRADRSRVDLALLEEVARKAEGPKTEAALMDLDII